MRGMWTDQSAGGMIADNRGNVVTGGGSTTGYKDIPTTAQFRLLEGKAQLRLPQPPTCGICTGYNKWIDVKELKIDEDRISGKIRYDILTGVSFEIDRRTGIMTSKNGFEGLCEAQDLAQRKF